MTIWELLIISLGLSMDAFAVSITLGLGLKKSGLKSALTVGLYFGFFQAAMPLIGYFLGIAFADKIKAFDHFIAFGLLLIIGGKMVFESFKKEQLCKDRECPQKPCTDRECPKQKETSLCPAKMLPLAVATSIDALAVGVSFAFLSVSIAPAVSLIGAVTLALSAIGVKIGTLFGSKLKSKAELIGGIILILMGVKILLEHLGIINF